jgi:hypothetical protein
VSLVKLAGNKLHLSLYLLLVVDLNVLQIDQSNVHNCPR